MMNVEINKLQQMVAETAEKYDYGWEEIVLAAGGVALSTYVLVKFGEWNDRRKSNKAQEDIN